jgi:hypothetical protein
VAIPAFMRSAPEPLTRTRASLNTVAHQGDRSHDLRQEEFEQPPYSQVTVLPFPFALNRVTYEPIDIYHVITLIFAKEHLLFAFYSKELPQKADAWKIIPFVNLNAVRSKKSSWWLILQCIDASWIWDGGCSPNLSSCLGL